MKIVITGVTGFRNRGVEALVRPTVEQLKARYANASIQIVSRSPAYDEQRLHAPHTSYLQDAFYQGGHWVQPPLWKNMMHMVTTRTAQKLGISDSGSAGKIKDSDLHMPFESADLVIVSGGDLFSSDYGTTSLSHFCAPVRWAKKHGVPVALIGQSVGRFKNEADISLWRQMEEDASLITLRESHTQSYLSSQLGSRVERLPVTADTAFLLDADTTFADQQLLPADGPWVALSISESISGWTGLSYEAHKAAWKQLIEMMLDRWSVRVAIIPHVQENSADDRLVSTKIARELGFDKRVRVFAEDLGAAEFKGLVSRCDMVVAERMHAAIAGLSTGRCTVPIGYSIKAEGITSAVLEGSGLEASDIVVPVSDLLDAPATFDKLDRIWKQRTAYATAIAQGASRQKKLALQNFEMISSLLAPKA
jgi:colanic acid/amylovoran biosynthesis protein